MLSRNLPVPSLMLVAILTVGTLAGGRAAASEAGATTTAPQAQAPVAAAPEIAPATSTVPEAPATLATPQAQAPAAPAELTPLHQEIRAVVEQQRAQVEALAAQMARESDPTRQLELQRAVEAAKRQVQIAVLQAQLRHAQSEDKTDAATALQTALDQVLHADVAAKPVDRPATPPSAGAR